MLNDEEMMIVKNVVRLTMCTLVALMLAALMWIAIYLEG